MKLFTIVLGLAIATGVAVGCSSSGSPSSPGADGNDAGTAASGPTFHKDLEPILQRTCQSCHVPGGIAPFSLVSYEDAKAYAADMVAQTSTKKMPPWGADATNECAPRIPFKGDMRLSDKEIATFKAWLDAGKLEGDPKDAPPPRQPVPDGLPDATMELPAPSPYTLTATTDQFRCFVIDPKITQTSYINATHVVAGNKHIVHHVLVYADPLGQSKAKADANGQYSCFGGPGISSPVLVTGWVPGQGPIELPSNAGGQIDPGTLLVMQVHYHPSGNANEPADVTKIQLRMTSTPPDYVARFLLPGNFTKPVKNGTGLLSDPDDADPSTPQFLIPANKSAHTETMQFTVPATIGGFPTPTLSIYTIAGHMHYVGVDEKVTVARQTPPPGEPASECLLQIPRWNFNWQRSYTFDAPIEQLPTIAGGDVLTIRCTYDNTMNNPFVVDALRQQSLSVPTDVRLGETTLDEMCLAPVAVLYKAK